MAGCSLSLGAVLPWKAGLPQGVVPLHMLGSSGTHIRLDKYLAFAEAALFCYGTEKVPQLISCVSNAFSTSCWGTVWSLMEYNNGFTTTSVMNLIRKLVVDLRKKWSRHTLTRFRLPFHNQATVVSLGCRNEPYLH